MSRAARILLSLAALALGACSAFATPSPTLTPTWTPTSTREPTPTRTPTPTLTPSPTPTPTPTETPTPTPTETPTPPPTVAPEPSAGGLWNGLWPEPPARPFHRTVAQSTAPRLVPNALRRFWVTDATTMERMEVTARLRVQTDHAQMWVEEATWHDIGRLQEAAAVFEGQIYPRTRAALGSEWTPGVDNDPHILILHATRLGEGVAGYSSGIDELPRTGEPFSNEAELIVVSAALEVGSAPYYALLARQLAYIVQWPNDRNEAHWLEQGLADHAARLSGSEPDGAVQAYLGRPDVPLAVDGGGSDPARRGAAYLLVTYFHERFQDNGTQALVAQPLNSVAGIEATLAQLDGRLSFEEFFADWLAAVYLDGEPGALPLHGYDSLHLEHPSPAATVEAMPATLEASVHQFGADYIVLRGEDDLDVAFEGVTQTVLLDVAPHGGNHFWWSNRADESRATLTRSFDLSGVERATLSYWAWYDIEPGFDYAMVEISLDDGDRWENVAASGSSAGALGANSPDWTYTGQSGAPPGWVHETIDLTPYAGQAAVMVQFVYVTDGAVTGLGLALDDLTIPEIGYASGAELGEVDWKAEGFLPTDGFVPQRYLTFLIGLTDRITVERLPVGEDQKARWLVPLASKGWREAVLVVSGLAPMTAQPALYSLEIEHSEVGD